MISELETKIERVQALLDSQGLDALLLQRVSSFAWASCGALSYINTATTTGEAALLIMRDGARHLITNNIEAPHYEKEEGLKAQGWQFHLAPWYGPNPAIADLTRGLKLGADVVMPGSQDLSSEVARLRVDLTPAEQARLRAVSADGAAALGAAADAVQPGMREKEIAGLIELEAERHSLNPVVVLVATDERIYNFRHPLPTEKKLERYAMLIICARRQGLVMAATRLVHFGRMPDELRRKTEAVARIDAQVMAATRPGRTLGEVFADLRHAYAAAGYEGEWQLHHQGGSIAYEPREFIANPASAEKVNAGQAFAWNPSITGSKSEDTMLLGESGPEVLTVTPGWPTVAIEVGGQVIERPLVWEK